MKNKFWNKNTITACLFVITLFTYAVLNAIYTIQNSRERLEISENQTDIADYIKNINDYVEENVYLKYPIIESYGVIQKVLLKHEFNHFDKVIDKQGYLFDGNFYSHFGANQKEVAIEARKLMDYAKQYGAEFSFVVTPIKTVLQENTYLGLPYNDFTGSVDDLLRGLRYYNVPYLDLGASLELSGLSYEEIFYKRDHHWKTKAAFQGYQDIISWMEEQYLVTLDLGEQSRNLNNYETKLYPNLMFGSYGRDVGKYYSSGSEDFEVFYPKHNGNYTVEYGALNDYEIRNGGFDNALVQNDIDQKITDVYQDSCYDLAFLYGLSDYIRITNNEKTDAPKILLLRDSFASPLGCFMAQNFSSIDMVYMLGEERDQVLKMIAENDYDYVMLCIYPENLALENVQLFEEVKDE